jgi:hypothetical protein
MINYHNKFIDKKHREMMKIQTNIWFLKEVMTHNPNLSLYVLGPFNMLYRIHGVVSKRDQNVIIQMEKVINSEKYDYEFTYSASKTPVSMMPIKVLFPQKNYRQINLKS